MIGATAVGALTRDLVEVGEGLFAVVQRPPVLGVANAAVATEEGDALVFDTLLNRDMASGLHASLRHLGAQPCLVVNSHHHLDHVGGNSTFADSTRIVAHAETVRAVAAMAADPTFVRELPGELARSAGVPEIRVPERMGRVEVPRGGALLSFADAHSPADVVAWFPGQRVLLAGDLCFNEATPLALHGSVPRWLAAVRCLLALEPVTVVPGHGDVGTMSLLEAMEAYLAALWDVATSAVLEGCPVSVAARRVGDVSFGLAAERTYMNLAAAMTSAARLAGKEQDRGREAASAPHPDGGLQPGSDRTDRGASHRGLR